MTKPKYAEPDTPLIAKYRARFDGSTTGEPLSFAEAKELFNAYQKLNKRLARIARISDNYQGEVKRLVLELQDALANVKTLKGFIPICASCKKIRNDEGYWKQMEQFISENSDALFSHGLCPDCLSNYRSLSLKSKDTAPPPNAPHMLHESDLDDPVILRFLPIINNKHFANTPLFNDFSALFQKYVRLTKRMKRIAKISDNYQSRLKEVEEERQRLSD